MSGQVTLYDDFQKNISVKAKLSYTYRTDRKGRVLEKNIDPLRASILIFRLDTLVATEKTDYRGHFNLSLSEKDIYRIKFELMSKVYKDTVINLQASVSKVNICLSDSGLHNYYLRKVPYDSIRAKTDILNDTIRIVELISTEFSGCRLKLLYYLSLEEKESIENKFGFKYTSFVIDKISQNYLDQREREYNAMVYKYLDKKVNGDSNDSIEGEIFRVIHEKRKKQN